MLTFNATMHITSGNMAKGHKQSDGGKEDV